MASSHLFTFLYSHAAAVVAGLALIYLLSKTIYTLYFHPLAKYPGPFIAKFTNLYASYHGWRGDIHLDMWRCHQHYGDYVRYTPEAILFNNARALKDIHGASSNVRKGKAYGPMVHRAPNTLTIRDNKEHSRRRRIMSQGVSQSAQRGYESRIISHINGLCSDFTAEIGTKPCGWTEPLDISQWSNYLSFDIMADVVFSAAYNLVRNPRFRYVCEAIDASNVRVSTLIQAPSLAGWKLDKYVFPSAIKARNRFVKFVSRVVKERMEKTEKPGASGADVFSNLVNAKDPETGIGFHSQEIGAESTTLIVAGSDTTSTSIASVFFYLTHNPGPLQRAAQEVREKFSSQEEITMGPTLNGCTYLRACIDESMRMSPAVGSSLWREVSEGGATIDGHFIPAGYDVGTGIYSLHHSAAYYDMPFEYRPERWLVGEGGATKASVDLAHSAFNPFSIGPRSCLGKGLALTEVMLAMATFLWVFDIKLAEGELGRVGEGKAGNQTGRHREHEYQLYDHVTSTKKGPFVQFALRKPL